MAVIDLTPQPRLPPHEARLIQAALECIGRWGVAKTTLDDVARHAGCSRATVYRVFPGGKESLIEATVRHEIRRFLSIEADALDGCDSLEDLLTVGMFTAARHLAEHDALQFLLVNEPEVILPLIAFSRMDRVFTVVREFFAPYLAPHVGAEEAPRVAEWVTRLTVSYTLCPSNGYDICDADSVRQLVRTFVLPGLVEPATTRAATSMTTRKV